MSVLLAATAAPAQAQAPSPIPPVAAAATAQPAIHASVKAYYQLRDNAPIWLTGASGIEAARTLVQVLKRAPIDGLAAGPLLGAQVEAALARAQGAPAAASLADDQMISAIWVQYVQALARPAAGMSYGDKALAPQVPSVSAVLSQAAKAGSLAEHVREVSSVNPVYAALRDAAWPQAQLAGVSGLDQRLLVNLERARILPRRGRFIIVDAATARLWMYEDGSVQDSMKVIVGKKGTPTPMLAGTIHYATFNPYWNIPTDVAKRVVAPLVLKRGTGYLKLAEYEVASDWTDAATVVPPDQVDWKAIADGSATVRIRQLPGPNNMMGALKFGFANDLGIYLHDTPEKKLFDKSKRNFSLGCVRVEDAQRLGRWLLGREPVAPSSDPEQHVKLAKGVPIYITYLTAEASGGQVTFAEDVYGRDPAQDTRLAAAEQPKDSAADPAPAASGTLPH